MHHINVNIFYVIYFYEGKDLLCNMAKKPTTRGTAQTKAKAKKSVKDPDLVELGQRIKELRIKAGYTSAEIFAYDHDLPRTVYVRCEAGTNLTYKNLRRIVRLFGLSLQEFVKDFQV